MRALPVVAIFFAARALRGTCAFSQRPPRCPALARFPHTIRLRQAQAVRPRAAVAAIPQMLCELQTEFAVALQSLAFALRQDSPTIRHTIAAFVNGPRPVSSLYASAML